MSADFLGALLGSLDETAFEEWLAVLYQAIYRLPRLPQRIGRRGQAQKGVDVYFRSPQGEEVGVQAKAYKRTKLTQALLDEEVKAAHEFKPPLDRYIVCTLGDRDAVLQEHARLSKLHGNQGRVEVRSLQDLTEEAGQHPEVLSDLVQRLPARLHDAMRDAVLPMQPPATPALAAGASERDPDQDPALQAIEDRIDAGQPARALAELDRYAGPARGTALLRVRTRALFAQDDYSAVRATAVSQASTAAPDPLLLAYGAHAAQLDGDAALADEWIDRAMSLVLTAQSGHLLAQVVGAFLRIHALRRDRTPAQLEAFAGEHMADLTPIALALADSAFLLGDNDRAVHWYGVARDRPGRWPEAAQANALGAEMWQLVESANRGEPNAPRLAEVVRALEQMLAHTVDPTLRDPVNLNIGFGHWSLGNVAAAAAAWDQTLATPAGTEDLWIRRCILSSEEKVPLPSPPLIARWAVTPIAQVALASAYIAQGDYDGAGRLLDTARNSPGSSSNDQALVAIETIRLETRNNDAGITAAHVGTVLAAAALEPASPAAFVWLVDHYAMVGVEQVNEVHRILAARAGELTLETGPMVALTETLVLAGLEDIAVPWIPHLEQMALDRRGDVRHVRAAILLPRLYTRVFRFAEARALIGKLRPSFPTEPSAVLHAAKSLDEAGDRPAAYETVRAAIEDGQRHPTLVLTWAKLAVLLGKQRQARRILRGLVLTPADPSEYAAILHARALLRLQGTPLPASGEATQVTPATASRIFAASSMAPPPRPARADYGSVVQLRIEHQGRVKLDERVLLLERPGRRADGARALAATEVPWVAEVLGAVPGERRILQGAPFAGATADILDVFTGDRWDYLQAAELLHLLPPETTGIHAFSGDLDQLKKRMSEQAQRVRVAREGQIAAATASRMSLALVAATMTISPRLLLRREGSWVPAGTSGDAAVNAADESAIKAHPRLVLDPITVLLLVDTGAEALIEALPSRPVMTPQAVTQLFDWWYTTERAGRGTRGHLVAGPDGTPAILEIGARQRRETTSYWRRVADLVKQHVDVQEAGPITDPEVVQMARLLGPPTVSGMALAQQQGWLYVTEEDLVRAAAQKVVRATPVSLHVVGVQAANEGAWATEEAMELLTKLIRHGWSWVGFPAAWLDVALRLPKDRARHFARPLLERLALADIQHAVPLVCTLLFNLDLGAYRHLPEDELRARLVAALPSRIGRRRARVLAEGFGRVFLGPRHRASRKAVRRWADRVSDT